MGGNIKFFLKSCFHHLLLSHLSLSFKSMEKSIVSVKHLSIIHGAQNVLENVSFQIEKGEFVYLIGKTGSGKSSILKTLYADLPLQKGEIDIFDMTLSKIKKSEVPILRRRIGIIFQDFQLFTDRNVENNLRFVLEATGWEQSAKIKQRIGQVLAQVGLLGIDKKMPHQLSGGEQQRVVIARALLNDPDLILADEPTGNLDPTVADEILDLFVQISKGGTAIFIATHHHSFLKKYPARVLWCEHNAMKDFSKEEVLQKMIV
jgi:cell division transport system ATP-binding protein